MSKRKVLILGVGNAQVDAIERCKQAGCEVHGLSYLPEGAGIPMVDHFAVINIVDKKSVFTYACDHAIDILYSVGSDIAMPTVGYVCERASLPFFVSEDTADFLQDKGRQRAFLQEKGLSPVTYQTANSEKDFAGWNVFPAVLKPVDSQGQRGVLEVKEPGDIVEKFNLSLSHSRCGRVIIEQYIIGPEISANAFVYQSEVIYCFFTDRYVIEDAPGGIVRGHRIPTVAPKSVQDKARSLVLKVVAAVGIENGPVYFQMKYINDEVFIIEVAPRLDGCHIWRLINLKYGVNLLELSFILLENRFLLTENQRRSPVDKQREALFIDFFLQRPETVFFTPNIPDTEVLFRQYYYQSGEKVRPVNGIWDKTGYQIRLGRETTAEEVPTWRFGQSKA